MRKFSSTGLLLVVSLSPLLTTVASAAGSGTFDWSQQRWIQYKANAAEDNAKDYTDAYVDSLQAQLDTLQALADTADVGGQIIFWYGDSADCPAGWSICNGDTWYNSDSTDTLIEPDMVGRFVVCAGGSGDYSPSDTGGVDSVDFAHTHTISASGTHTHGISPGAMGTIQVGTGVLTTTDPGGDHDHGGATGSSLAYIDNRPRFIALWPIVRVKF